MNISGIETAFPGQLPEMRSPTAPIVACSNCRTTIPVSSPGSNDRAHYLAQQLNAWYVQMRLGSLSHLELIRVPFARLVSSHDWLLFSRLLVPRLTPRRLRSRLSIDRDDPQSQLWPGDATAPGGGEYR